jgi:soluble lytic murein transglycosylase-like protein
MAGSLMSHNRLSTLTRVMAAVVAVWAFMAMPARGEQIVLVDDGHGHKVYVNLDDPPASAAKAARTFKGRALPPAEIEKLVEQTAKRYNVDAKLIQAVIQVESDYNPQALSNKGAMGLMQLIPSTAQRFGVQNAYNPKQNIEGGVNYLKYLLNLFNGDLSLSLAAYNAGENAVLRRGGIPQIPETENYVKKVRRLYDSDSDSMTAKSKTANPVTIYRYVDASGVVHYTDGGDL